MYFRKAFLIAVIVIFTYILWPGSSSTKAANDTTKTGDMAKFKEQIPRIPISKTPFINENGKKTNLHTHKGNWLLVNFWATWCAPCIRELPYIYNLKQEMSTSKIKILLISIDRSGPSMFQPVLDKLKLKGLKSASDPKAALMRALKLSGVPTTLLIDPNGLIAGSLTGDAIWDSPRAIALLNHYINEDLGAQ